MRIRQAILVLAALSAACQKGSGEPEPSAPERSAKLVRAAEPIADRYVVQLADGVSEADARALAARHGATVLRYLPPPANAIVVALGAAHAPALAEEPAVRLAEEDARVRVASTDWGRDRLDQRAREPQDGFRAATSGADVHLYVVDTDVVLGHPELEGRADAPASFSERPPGECSGHGTHLAAIAAGRTVGVAPAAAVHAVRAVDCDGVGSVSSLLAALEWVRASRAAPAVALVGVTSGLSPALDEALRELVAAGVTVVAPAGNDAADACARLPAAVPEVLAAGATTWQDAVLDPSAQGACVDLFAPGAEIWSAWSDGGYRFATGTSQAAAHVAGAAALFLAAHPDAAPARVADALTGNATLGVLSGVREPTPNRLLYVGFISTAADTAPPAIAISSPAAAEQVSGTIPVSVTTGATDVTQVAVFVDGQYVGADASGADGWSVPWPTARFGNGSHVVTARAYDASGNSGEAEVTVAVANPGNAAYDPELKAPACATAGPRCASGELLLGRGPAGPEANAPNTIRALCADGAAGVYLRDESIERIEVSAAAGAAVLAEGGWVNVDVTVRAYPDFANDRVDLFFARDANAPVWEYLGTKEVAGAGEQKVTFTYRLPAFPDEPKGTLQAVRATIRYGGAPEVCSNGPYDDHDDLVFEVAPGTPDVAPPVVTLAVMRAGVPVAEGGTISGAVELEATTLEAGGGSVTRVEFFVAKELVATAFAPSGGVWRATWNADLVETGEKIVHAFAFDTSGNAGRSGDVKVKIADLSAPAVAIDGPAPGAVVGGVVRVEADATDNRGVAKVEFRSGGEVIGTATALPWAIWWDTAGLLGPATIVAQAWDAAQLTATSGEVAVEIDNAVPTVSIDAPAPNAIVPEAYEVVIDARDDRAVAAVDLFAAGAYVDAAQSGAVPNQWTVVWRTGSLPNGLTSIRARARDLAGNVAWSAEVPVEVKDSTPPAVVITEPAAGALVRGVVPVSATATDAGLVTEVEFRAGDAIIDVDRFAPYQVSWNTTALADGPVTLRAIARDGAPSSGEATLEVTVDNHGPEAWILPLASAPARGTVAVKVHAADVYGVDRVEVWTGDVLLGRAGPVAGELDTYEVAWITTDFDNGTHELRAVAYDAAGNVTTSAPLAATVSNVTTASFDPTLGVPACSEPAAWCTSGSLLAGAGPGEVNGPNTLDPSCVDGVDSVAQQTESIEGLRVEAGQGALSANAAVKLHVRYFAVTANEADQIDVYHAADAANPAWRLLATLTPPAPGTNEAVLKLTLPTGPRQAIRANFRFAQPGPVPCSGGAYGDRDDLVFTVGTPADATPPTITLLGPVDGAVVAGDVLVRTTISDDQGVARVDLVVDGATVETLVRPDAWFASRYTALWPAGLAADGPHTIEVRASDTSGNVATTGPVSVVVRNLPNAAWDPALKAPACLGIDSFCDTGALLLGRGLVAGGPETNAPNTLASSCLDGDDGAYRDDESLEWLKVTSVDGLPLAAGKRARVEARVFAYSGWSDDALDLYITSTPDDPHWSWVATLRPQGPGLQSLWAELTLAPSGFQAVRGRYRYGGAAAPCGYGRFDDHDDVAFAVEYAPNATFDATLRVPACSGTAAHCDAGSLLDGRGSLGPEPNAPNTLRGVCADGTVGTYHVDASVDGLLVRMEDGGLLRAAAPARVEVRVFASAAYADERVDLFVSNPDDPSPAWERVAVLYPTRQGSQVLVANPSFATAGRLAVRARLLPRSAWTSIFPVACGTATDARSIDDHDDIVFTVSGP